jgi:hypothetical protein
MIIALLLLSYAFPLTGIYYSVKKYKQVLPNFYRFFFAHTDTHTLRTVPVR